MCGIVGAIAERSISDILIEGLHRLEYRGYDSAGVAVICGDEIKSHKRLGKVAVLEEAVKENPLTGHCGIAHTRWATHGKPEERNAHPHFSGGDLALVHNGIIENYQELREELQQKGYEFLSDTDTEVVAHLLNEQLKNNGGSTLDALKVVRKKLQGAYSLAIINNNEPEKIIVARSGSPLVIGRGFSENFIASDTLALRAVTDRFTYLEEGDVAEVSKDHIAVFDENDAAVFREEVKLKEGVSTADKGHYRHFMLKEIFEQPEVIRATLDGRVGSKRVLQSSFGSDARELFSKVKRVQILACGTSYHAGMVARYWIEEIAKLPCSVEVASEYRYRKSVVEDGTLFVSVSQSGETADTLAALREAKQENLLASLAIVNVPESSLVRESDLVFMTHAGPEIGVASTKAFTTQLVALFLLTVSLARHNGMSKEVEQGYVDALKQLPEQCEKALDLDRAIQRLSNDFAEKHHALFLGRGVEYPIAMEGALKLKEISYIHAEAYPAGELKHGPLALVDNEMPIIVVAPNNDLLEKLKSNLEEVRARGGVLYVFADVNAGFKDEDNMRVVNMPHVELVLSPIIYTIPLQLLSYYVAVIKGTDVDQPRNLAKSVTVE